MSAALREVWTHKGLWAIHIVANAALLAAIYGWLGIPDRTVTQLVLSALAGLGIVLLVTWLHAGTLYFFARNPATGERHAWASFKLSLRQIAGFALWLLLLAAAITLVLQLKQHLQPSASWLASELTFRLRRPVRPAAIAGIFSCAVEVLAWLVTPMVFIQIWKRTWSWTYAMACAAVFVAGVYIPYRLIWWVPKIDGLYLEGASMALRFFLAYLLAVTSWLVLAATLGGPARQRATLLRREQVPRQAGL